MYMCSVLSTSTLCTISCDTAVPRSLVPLIPEKLRA